MSILDKLLDRANLTLDPIEKGEEILEEFREYGAVSVYLGGSLCMDIITGPRDYDFIVFIDNTEDITLVSKAVKHNRENITKNAANDICIQIRSVKDTKRLYYWSYYQNSMRLLAGQELDLTIDIFNNDNYKKVLKYQMNRLIAGRACNINQKLWYHILIGMYALINKSYTLTTAQKATVNLVHNSKSISAEVFDWCLSQTILDSIGLI